MWSQETEHASDDGPAQVAALRARRSELAFSQQSMWLSTSGQGFERFNEL